MIREEEVKLSLSLFANNVIVSTEIPQSIKQNFISLRSPSGK